MRRLTWTMSLRAALLAAGISLGAGTVLDPSILRSTVVAAEEAGVAATVEEAAKVIDLSTLPLPEGARDAYQRHLSYVTYRVDGDSKSAFQFQQTQLAKLGWKELPGTVIRGEYISASLQKSGFVLSVSSSASSDPGKPKSATVSLSNLGNLRLSKLPAVTGAKQVFASDVAATYTTTLKLADATTATRKLLMDAGWEPYGSQSNPPDSEVLTFKRNAIRLSASVGAHPTQKGQVMISYNSTLMTADIPAPTNAKDVGFDDTQKVLKFQSPDTFDDVAKFYQQRLAKMGWTPDSKELSKSKYGDNRPLGELHFRNTAKDSLLLQLTEQEETTRVRLSLKTAADSAALQKELNAATEKLAAEEKSRKEAEAKASASKPAATKPAAKSDDGFPDIDALIKSKIAAARKEAGLDAEKPAKGAAEKGTDNGSFSVPIPAGAVKVIQASDDTLRIKWPGGKGQASAEALRLQLLAAGWEIGDADEIKKNSGEVKFKKDGLRLRMSFTDGDFPEANMYVRGDGLKLTEGKADPNAKVPTASAKPKTEAEPSGNDALKALQKKLGSRLPKANDGKDAPFVGPPRPEKTKKGIDKLPKLTSAAKIIVNGETIALPHVLAYETVSAGQWVTRIVATDKPISQESWIARLRLPGENRDFDLPTTPWLRLELDDKDRPDAINLAVGQFQTDAGDRNFKGDAIVEDGRARGSIQTKDPVEFGGRTITAEITFDVPLLTRDSQPTRQLPDAPKLEPSEPDKPKKGIAKLPKLESSGALLVNGKPVKLGNVVAYELMVSGKKTTAINFTDKPINLTKLMALLARDGSDMGLFDFDSQAKLEFDQKGELSVILVAHDNDSFPIIGGSNVVSDVIIEDSRARGTVKLGEPKKFSGKSYSLDLTFDVEVLKLPATDKE